MGVFGVCLCACTLEGVAVSQGRVDSLHKERQRRAPVLLTQFRWAVCARDLVLSTRPVCSGCGSCHQVASVCAGMNISHLKTNSSAFCWTFCSLSNKDKRKCVCWVWDFSVYTGVSFNIDSMFLALKLRGLRTCSPRPYERWTCARLHAGCCAFSFSEKSQCYLDRCFFPSSKQHTVFWGLGSTLYFWVELHKHVVLAAACVNCANYIWLIYFYFVSKGHIGGFKQRSYIHDIENKFNIHRSTHIMKLEFVLYFMINIIFFLSSSAVWNSKKFVDLSNFSLSRVFRRECELSRWEKRARKES